MSLADYAEAEALKYLFTTETMGTRPTAWYLALHAGDPSDAGGANEVAAGWHVRQSCGLTRVGSSVSNTADATFAAVTGAPVTITHASIRDAVSGGNCLSICALPAPRTFAIGDIPVIQAGALTFVLD